MGKSRFTETQIITILKEVEKGRTVKDVCREYSVSDATYYQWKSKYGGLMSMPHKRRVVSTYAFICAGIFAGRNQGKLNLVGVMKDESLCLILS